MNVLKIVDATSGIEVWLKAWLQLLQHSFIQVVTKIWCNDK